MTLFELSVFTCMKRRWRSLIVFRAQKSGKLPVDLIVSYLRLGKRASFHLVRGCAVTRILGCSKFSGNREPEDGQARRRKQKEHNSIRRQIQFRNLEVRVHFISSKTYLTEGSAIYVLGTMGNPCVWSWRFCCTRTKTDQGGLRTISTEQMRPREALYTGF